MSAGHGAAWRRRERHLRAWHRHERMTPQRTTNKKTEREGVQGEKYFAPRRPKPPLGYELLLALDVPVLQMAEQPVDASALTFLEDLAVEYLELGRTASSGLGRAVAGGRSAEARAPPERSREEEEGGRSDFLALLVLAWCLGAARGVHGLVPVFYALLGFTVDEPEGLLCRDTETASVARAVRTWKPGLSTHPRYLARTCSVPVALEEHRKIGTSGSPLTFFFDSLYLAVTYSAFACGGLWTFLDDFQMDSVFSSCWFNTGYMFTSVYGSRLLKTVESPQLQSTKVVDISFAIPMVLATMETSQLRVDTVVDSPICRSHSSSLS